MNIVIEHATQPRTDKMIVACAARLVGTLIGALPADHIERSLTRITDALNVLLVTASDENEVSELAADALRKLADVGFASAAREIASNIRDNKVAKKRVTELLKKLKEGVREGMRRLSGSPRSGSSGSPRS